MEIRRSARRRIVVLALAGLATLAVGARVVAASGKAKPIGRGVVVIDTNLAYQGASAAGTGIVLTSSGKVLTNNHVINGATMIKAVLPGTGHSYTAKVVGYDKTADVAVLQLEHASSLKTLSVGDSSRLTVGSLVTAYGNAGGTGSFTSATGRVTGLGKTITASDDQGRSAQLTGLIETNAGVVPGDSGGPALCRAGRVVGAWTRRLVGRRLPVHLVHRRLRDPHRPRITMRSRSRPARVRDPPHRRHRVPRRRGRIGRFRLQRLRIADDVRRSRRRRGLGRSGRVGRAHRRRRDHGDRRTHDRLAGHGQRADRDDEAGHEDHRDLHGSGGRTPRRPRHARQRPASVADRRAGHARDVTAAAAVRV
jgi:hypothetical protein